MKGFPMDRMRTALAGAASVAVLGIAGAPAALAQAAPVEGYSSGVSDERTEVLQQPALTNTPGAAATTTTTTTTTSGRTSPTTLPFTGGEVVLVAAAGGTALAAGVVLLAATRRRGTSAA
jgi:hypothetical protein